MKIIKLIPIVILGLALGACVQTSTGGSNFESSDEDALEGYLQLSMGYLAQNDLANTRRHLNNVMDIDSNNSTAFGLWGLLYSAEGDLDLADDSFRRALRIDSRNSQVRNNYAAFLFANMRYQDAYRELERVVEDTEYPSRSQAFENMGLAAIQINNLSDAEYAFMRAIQLNSNQLQSSLELADISLEHGDINEASDYYTNFLTLVQFYNIDQTARSLWVGIKLAQAQGNTSTVEQYGERLNAGFVDSSEHELYQQSLIN